MKEIPLTMGEVALIDDEDYEEVSKYKWSVSKNSKILYAVTRVGEIGNKKRVSLHRFIMNYKGKLYVDLCTNQQNQWNSCGKTDHKGVYWNKKNRKWVAQIMINRKTLYLGSFKSKEKASQERKNVAMSLHGEFFKEQ
jgi:hypothetical protein